MELSAISQVLGEQGRLVLGLLLRGRVRGKLQRDSELRLKPFLQRKGIALRLPWTVSRSVLI